jgi:serine/threonine protein kinase
MASWRGAAPHRAGIALGDLKPANVLLRRADSGKLLDVGPAVELRGQPPRRTWSSAYVPPEALDGGADTPRAGLASEAWAAPTPRIRSPWSPVVGRN